MNKVCRVAVMSLAIILLAAPAALAGSRAKEALKEATAAAKKWKSDSFLVSISSLTVKGDGSASSWLHTFYSPSTKKSLIITAKGKALDELEVDRSMLTLPVGEGFLDSDKAMSEAKKHGLKGKDPSMGLNIMGAGPTATPCWSVNGGFEKGDVSVMLNGVSGAFIRKEVMPGF